MADAKKGDVERAQEKLDNVNTRLAKFGVHVDKWGGVTKPHTLTDKMLKSSQYLRVRNLIALAKENINIKNEKIRAYNKFVEEKNFTERLHDYKVQYSSVVGAKKIGEYREKAAQFKLEKEHPVSPEKAERHFTTAPTAALSQRLYFDKPTFTKGIDVPKTYTPEEMGFLYKEEQKFIEPKISEYWVGGKKKKFVEPGTGIYQTYAGYSAERIEAAAAPYKAGAGVMGAATVILATGGMGYFPGVAAAAGIKATAGAGLLSGKGLAGLGVAIGTGYAASELSPHVTRPLLTAIKHPKRTVADVEFGVELLKIPAFIGGAKFGGWAFGKAAPYIEKKLFYPDVKMEALYLKEGAYDITEMARRADLAYKGDVKLVLVGKAGTKMKLAKLWFGKQATVMGDFTTKEWIGKPTVRPLSYQPAVRIDYRIEKGFDPRHYTETLRLSQVKSLKGISGLAQIREVPGSTTYKQYYKFYSTAFKPTDEYSFLIKKIKPLGFEQTVGGWVTPTSGKPMFFEHRGYPILEGARIGTKSFVFGGKQFRITSAKYTGYITGEAGKGVGYGALGGTEKGIGYRALVQQDISAGTLKAFKAQYPLLYTKTTPLSLAGAKPGTVLYTGRIPGVTTVLDKPFGMVSTIKLEGAKISGRVFGKTTPDFFRTYGTGTGVGTKASAAGTQALIKTAKAEASLLKQGTFVSQKVVTGLIAQTEKLVSSFKAAGTGTATAAMASTMFFQKPISKALTRQLTYAPISSDSKTKQLMITRKRMVEKIKQEVAPAVITDVITLAPTKSEKLITNYLTSTATGTETLTTIADRIATVPVTDVGTIVDVIPALTPTTRVATLTRTATRSTAPPTLFPVLPIIDVGGNGWAKIPKLPQLFKKMKRMKYETGFEAYAKRQGKWFKLTTKAMSKSAALGWGARYTARTAGATFRIKPTPIKLRVSKRDYSWDSLKGMFRKGKRKGEYVELTKYRIDMPGEKQEITLKGLDTLYKWPTLRLTKKKRRKLKKKKKKKKR